MSSLKRNCANVFASSVFPTPVGPRNIKDIRNIKEELEGLKVEAEQAELESNLSRAAEIRYGKIPELQKALVHKESRLKKLQSSRRMLKEEITEEDIAGVVARWTGIPVHKMLEGEREKLQRMSEELTKEF